VPVISHNERVSSAICRRADGKPYAKADEVRIKDLTLVQLQATFIQDKKDPAWPRQNNDRALSPVAVEFASNKEHGLPDAYALPTVKQLFAFVREYVKYYKTGPGRFHPDAERRWKNAERVHFNIETKVLPETEEKGDGKGEVQPEEMFTRALGKVIREEKMQERATIQAFDVRSFRRVMEEFQDIGAVFLAGGPYRTAE